MECIELMIVVAIIGILAAVAIPAYQDYITRSKVTELVTAASSCKASVAESYQANNILPKDIAAAGCSDNATQYISKLDVKDGIITVTGSTALDKAVGATVSGTGDNFVLKPTPGADATAPLSWSCTGSDIPKKFLPANCRGT